MPNILPESDKIWSIEAEAAVLGSMIVEPACIPQVLAIIRATDMFYLPEHQVIFDAIVNLHVHEAQIDGIMLRDELKHANQLKRIGGPEYISKILDNVPSSANAVYYAGIVRDRHQYRAMVRIVDQIRRVPDEPGTVNEQIEEIHRLALSIQPHREDEAFSFKDNVCEAVVSLDDQDKDCLTTGFIRVDAVLHGFYPKELIVIAGRPSMGKSCLALDMALYAAKDGHRIVIFSLEMGANALMQRAVFSTAKVDSEKWIERRVGQPEIDEVMRQTTALSKLDIAIYETVEDADKMYAICSMLAKTKKPSLIIVDHIQLMTTTPPIQKEYERLTSISRQLKRMAMHLDTRVLAVCQLNREVEKRTSHTPKLSDLRGSGSIEQDADKILLLHREDQYRKLENPNIEPDKLDGLGQVIVAKNRRGRTGIATLLFREEFTSFCNLAPEYLGEGPK